MFCSTIYALFLTVVDSIFFLFDFDVGGIDSDVEELKVVCCIESSDAHDKGFPICPLELAGCM